jgi:hypothetical protein
MLDVGDGMLEVEGSGRVRRFHSHQLTCVFTFLLFFFLSFFLFSCFVFHVSYFKNISGMNSVGSIRKMFDRTSGCIKRAMGVDLLSWMSMSHV